jgi:hypothetical protein
VHGRDAVPREPAGLGWSAADLPVLDAPNGDTRGLVGAVTRGDRRHEARYRQAK